MKYTTLKEMFGWLRRFNNEEKDLLEYPWIITKREGQSWGCWATVVQGFETEKEANEWLRRNFFFKGGKLYKYRNKGSLEYDICSEGQLRLVLYIDQPNLDLSYEVERNTWGEYANCGKD